MDENVPYSLKLLKGQTTAPQSGSSGSKGTIKISKAKIVQIGKDASATQGAPKATEPGHLSKVQGPAKKAMKKAIGLSTSKKAKAKPGTGRAKLIAQVTKKDWAKWEGPDIEMICRIMAGGDLAAGIFLHCIVKVWKLRKKKASWEGRDWLYMPRVAWANSAGLTENELKDRAIPRVKTYCSDFVTIKQRGTGANKRLWISLDMADFKHAMSGLPFDLTIGLLNGKGIGGGVPKANAYGKGL